MQSHAIPLAGEAGDRALPRQATVFVLQSNVDEGGSVEAAVGSYPDGLGG